MVKLSENERESEVFFYLCRCSMWTLNGILYVSTPIAKIVCIIKQSVIDKGTKSLILQLFLPVIAKEVNLGLAPTLWDPGSATDVYLFLGLVYT